MDILKNSLKVYLVLTVLTGVLYPILITGIGQICFPDQAAGSLLRSGDQIIGSKLIGQNFTQAKYFWSRPSATDYNPQPSSGSNLGATSKNLIDKIQERRLKYTVVPDLNAVMPPTDLLFASASGLDPEISLVAAIHQIPRVISARGLSPTQASALTKLVHDSLKKPDYGMFGQERINVLLLNIALDRQEFR